MSKHRKRWTPKEKSEIVAYYQQHGIGKASTEYDVSATSIYKWEAILNEDNEGLEISQQKLYKRKLRKMEREMHRLKLLVADQALEIIVKDELLKKKPSQK